MKKVLIFGIAGQTGSLMADYLLYNTDCSIVGIERKSSLKINNNINHLVENNRIEIKQGDIVDESFVIDLFKEYYFDYCINFAAQSHVGESWDYPAKTFQVNTIGVINILEAIRKISPNCRFINIGSSEQFGSILSASIDLPMRSRSIYGASKIASSELIKLYRDAYNLFVLQPICFNHESERRASNFITRKITKGVARIYKAIKLGETFDPIELGNIDIQRDWSHALDFCDGFWKMLNNDKPKEYVLSSDEIHTVRQFIQEAFIACNIFGTWHRPSNKPEEEILLTNEEWSRPLIKINPKFYRPLEPASSFGDSSSIRSELKWKPKISFKELVRRMVENDLKNE